MDLKTLKTVTQKAYETYGFSKKGKNFHLDLDDVYIWSGFVKARGTLYLSCAFCIRALHKKALEISKEKITPNTFHEFDNANEIILYFKPHSEGGLPHEIIPEEYTEENYFERLMHLLHKYFDPFKIDPLQHIRRITRKVGLVEEHDTISIVKEAEQFLGLPESTMPFVDTQPYFPHLLNEDFAQPVIVGFHKDGPFLMNGSILLQMDELDEFTSDESGYETVDCFVIRKNKLFFLACDALSPKEDQKNSHEIFVGKVGLDGSKLLYVSLGKFGYQTGKRVWDEAYTANFERFPKAQAQIKAVYRNGCIYVKDDQHTVKYDIVKGKLFRQVSDKDVEAAFAPRYSAKRSADGQALYVTKHETEETKVITFETLARTSPALKGIIENLKGRRVPLEDVERISLPSGDVIYETEQGLYFPLPVRDEWGNTANVIFRYDFAIEQCYYITSEYAGDASLLPYVIDIQA